MDTLKILILYGGEMATKPRDELLDWLNSNALHREIGRKIDARKVSELTAHSEGSIEKRVEDSMNWADKAIVLFTLDARSEYGAPNVLEEMWRWIGLKNKQSLLVLRQNGVKSSSNAHGMVYVGFEKNVIFETRDRIVAFINDPIFVQKYIEISSGNYVGRDQTAFSNTQPQNESSEANDPEEEPSNNSNTTTVNTFKEIPIIDKQINQAARLRGTISKIIPVQEALESFFLARKLRETNAFSNILSSSSENDVNRIIDIKLSQVDQQQYFERLNKIETILFGIDIEENDKSQALTELSQAYDEINIAISRLRHVFLSILHPASASADISKNLITKIGHQEFSEEAIVRGNLIDSLSERIDLEELFKEDFDILSNEGAKAIGVVNELEFHQFRILGLIQADRQKQFYTTRVVSMFLLILLTFSILVVVIGSNELMFDPNDLSSTTLPLIGVPWPILVWSLIGSIAAMILQFNRNPIQKFGNIWKWLLTRPMQGVVLGSAFYLIIVSGLFLLTKGDTDTSNGLLNEVVLVLSFLVGFSDRFADNVFNSLINRYSTFDDNHREKDFNLIS